MDFLGLGIGLPQLLMVLLVAMVVLGPDRLPEVARQMAKGMRTLRGYATDVQSQFGGELDEIREELLGIQRDISDVQGSLRGGLLDLDQSLRSVQTEFQDAAGAAGAPAQPGWQGEPGPAAGATAPPEFKPETPAAVRAAIYRPLPSPGTVSDTVQAQNDTRVPDYRPPA